ncbi:MAG: UDP-4-amino-4,6-dideoxy-N-acetyl-beta-L-altrosamine transaminase [Saprospiraceae bacterium]|nr:UDP-4-amino-4,6-dideoxy-N-acetyl-beta-L-altrosamine transaminase [Saprospiraceae bacterium]
MKAIPYGRQDITVADIEAVTRVLQSDYLTTGPTIKEFEDKFAQYVGAKHAVAIANATVGLHLCTMVMGVKPGSKVITTPITFAASANCVRYCGGEVDFADIDPSNLLIDLDQVEKMLEAAPAGTYEGIIPVDFAGFPVDIMRLRDIADHHGLWIIEDACHAPGGYLIDGEGTKQLCGNGAFADLSVFSFHPVKHIACGEGGMITTNDTALYRRLMRLRTHGITKEVDILEENHGGWYYEMHELGYNYRITDIQAALGVSQLDRARAGVVRRRAIAERYDLAFADTAVTTINVPEKVGHAFHLYVIQVVDRKQLYDRLREHKIYAQIHYIPVPSLPYYKRQGFKIEDYPNASNYYEHCISLPMYPSLTDEEQDFVIDQVKSFVG